MSERSILQEGRTCWRIAPADRVAILIDGAAYFGALRAALKEARHSIYIVGWDIDSRAPLVGPSGKAEDGRPRELGPFLTSLVEERPDLRIHLLLWDYSLLFALDREPLPSLNLDWTTPSQIAVCLDDVLPVGGSHHQKIVVIDDALAFSGGIDLTIRRWDVPDHVLDDRRRIDPKGEPYRPFHDVQMMVDGEAAAALAEIVRHRWHEAACEKPAAPAPSGDPWPAGVEPDFTDIEVGVARTYPAYDGVPEIREVECLYRRAIERAQYSAYIENQFLTAHSIAAALVARLRENPGLEVVIVGPNVHQSWLEERAMNSGRAAFMHRLEAAGVADRVALLYPGIPGDDSGQGVMVHAKLAVVDDCFLQVGSANLNNRSMGMDSECDLAIEATEPAHRRKIAEIRNRLLAEHLGTTADDVAKALEREGGLLGAVRALSHGERTLKPISLADAPVDEVARAVGQLADPERPMSPPVFVGDMFGAQPRHQARSHTLKFVAIGAGLLCLVALWQFTPLSDLTDPDALMDRLRDLGGQFWMPAVIPLAFLLGSLVAFPVTALIAVTGMMFGPPVAFAYALGGSLLGAGATYLVGRAAGRGPLRSLMGARVNRISRALARRGVLSIATLRMVPIAPFAFINLAAGASHVSFSDFMLGTALGMAPGILVITFLGNQLAHVLRNPEPGALVLLGLCVLAWIALSIGLQYLVSRLRRRKE